MKTELEVALRDPALKKSEMRELLASNLEEVDKLTKLSHTLLQLSRLDHESIVREKVSLKDTAEAVIQRFGKAGKRISLISHKPLYAYANASAVEELFTILIDNALKYSPEDSAVTVTLISRKQMVGFEVINAGPGIRAEDLPHIFDRFYRADPSRTSGEKRGYGLGLSLAKKIVELHHGDLTATSAPRQTTTFRVLLLNLSNNKLKTKR
jgi:two-component system OmpR family sensor kinase